MKILVVNGQPKKEGLSRYFSGEYAKKKRGEGHEVKVINVFDLDFEYHVDNIYGAKLEKSLVNSQEAIKWADHLVFFYPVWWVAMPSMLKCFLERILIPGFAFRYENGKPKKLLKGKTAQIYATAGGNKRYNFLVGRVDQYRTLGKLLWFCGVRLKRVKILCPIRRETTSEDIEKMKESLK